MFVADHHLFVRDGRHYVIDVERMSASSIDEEAAAALERLSADPDGGVDPETRGRLVEMGLLMAHEPEPQAEEPTEPPPISNITLFVTQECNLDCVYCYGLGGQYGSPGHMSSATGMKAVDWLVGRSGDVKKLSITFFGGEPLLNFPLIQEIVEYAGEEGRRTGKEFEFGITTNLLLLDEKKLEFIQKHKLKPMVSFDGPREIQEKQRPFKSGRGSSYNASIPKIKQILAVMPETPCRATIVGDADPAAVRESLCEIGFTSVHMAPDSESLLGRTPGDRERDLAHTMQAMEAEAESFLKDVEKRDFESLEKHKRTGFLCDSLGDLLNNQKRSFPCGAGRRTVAVSNSGDVFLCHRFVGTEEFKLGSVHAPDLDRGPYLRPSVDTMEGCSECFARYLCGGGCYHDNAGRTGSAFGPAEDFCRLKRKTMELVVTIAGNLSDSDKEYLVDEGIIPKKLPTQDELDRKKKKLKARLDALGFSEHELKEIRASLDQQT